VQVFHVTIASYTVKNASNEEEAKIDF